MAGILNTTEYIGSGSGISGSDSDTTIVAGGDEVLGYDFGTGTATGTTISGGWQYVGDVYGTGSATSTTIESASFQEVGFDDGIGTATSTTIDSGGEQDVGFDDGIGTATNTTIDGGGTQCVGDYFGNGTATNTTISGGVQILGVDRATGTATSTTISSGGTQYDGDYDGGIGTATSTTIGAGGAQYVGYGDGFGVATSTTIDSGGVQYVQGSATSTTINSYGVQYVEGTATSTTIDSSGAQYVEGGIATDTTIESGGLVDIFSGGVVDSAVFDGGTAVVDDGTLQLAAGASAGTGVIDFTAVSGFYGGTLDLTGEGSGLTSSPVISGFAGAGDTVALSDIIKVEGVAPTDRVVWTQNGASGTLQVETSAGTVLETLTLDGTYHQSQFTLSGSGSVDQIAYTASGILNTTEYIGSGSGVSGSDSGTTIVSGGEEYLGYDHGTGSATSATIDFGGYQYVGYDDGTGYATGTTISGGHGYIGYQYVGDGKGATGTAIGTTIGSDGAQYVGYDDGTGYATSTTISGGYGYPSYQYVGDGKGATGAATNTTIDSGGEQDLGIDNGTGTATNTTIDSDGEQNVGDSYGTGTATSTTIDSGGEQNVGDDGIGTATSTTIDSGGEQVVGVYGGTGTATSTTIDSGGEQDVGEYGTGTATSTTIDSGGAQYVGDDGIGTATSTTISGGAQYVGDDYGSGTATATTISAGGYQYVGDDGATGYATGTTISAGGYQYVGCDDGIGYASGTTIDSGGNQYVGSEATGIATSTTISGGGRQIVDDGGTATDTTVGRYGFAGILSGGVVDSPVIDGGALALIEGASVGSGGIDFAAVSGANGGTLELTGEGSGLTFTPVISDFTGTGETAATSDIIEVVGVAATDQVVWSQDGASGTLKVETSGGTVLETLTLDGIYYQNDFTLKYAANADSIAYDSKNPCYCKGTRILTEQGEVAIERLSIGDRVVTASGEGKPIRWIGHRRVEIARHPRPDLVRPVRIEAGALRENLPARDLLVSPEHALWLREALVPARDLLNGATIRQEAWIRVEYFHLEFDSHEILLAEGVPAESYLDCDNRAGFDNAPDGVVTLHPDWRRQAASRRFASSAQTSALRADFTRRAIALGRGAEIAAFEAERRTRGKVTRTNFVRNPRAAGSVPGIVGAGGHAPTLWWIGAPEGILVEVIGTGEKAGLPFIDLRFAGLAKTGGNCCIQPEPRKAASARPRQDWTVSCHLELVRGGFDGVEGVNLYIDERGANGAYLEGQDYPQPLPNADDLASQRVEATRQMSRPDVAAVTGYVQIKIAAEMPIDLTLRVAAPQIERGYYASDLILPPPGQLRPSTRDEALFAAPLIASLSNEGRLGTRV